MIKIRCKQSDVFFDDLWEFTAWLDREVTTMGLTEGTPSFTKEGKALLQSLVHTICNASGEEWEVTILTKDARERVNFDDELIAFRCTNMGLAIGIDDDGCCTLRVVGQNVATVAGILTNYRKVF